MPRNVLDDLPADLAFLAPAVRAMLPIRAAFHPSVDPKQFPDQATAEELDQCGARYQEILYAALKQRFRGESVPAYNRQVIALGDALWSWLNSYSGDWDAPEAELLYTIVSMIPRTRQKTWFQRAGANLGAAYARLTRPTR
jgi:hypothetical protein